MYTIIKFFIINLLLLLLVCASTAQFSVATTAYYPEVQHPDWYKVIPMIDDTTPEWMRALYEDSENYERIVTLRATYYKTHAFEKNIHTQNYKYWMRIVGNHINDTGQVDLPAPGNTFKAFEQKKKEKSNTKKRATSNTWTSIGSSTTYKSDGSGNTRPTQANVYCLAIAPSDPDILYAGMETGGIFKTIDKGLNWAPMSYDYAIGNIQDIKVDPYDADIVYISRGSAIYKTSDGGTTWSLSYTASSTVEQFLIHSTETDSIFAATRDGVLLSTDAGATWNSKFSGYVYDIEAKPGSMDTLYISTKNTTALRPEIFRSIDAGETWTLMDNGFYSPTDLNVATVYGCKIGVTPADPNRLYAGIIASGKTGDNGWIGIYYSLDAGETWQEDSGFDGGPYASGNDPSTNWYVGGYSNGYHQGWYNFDIDVSHNNADKLWIGTIWFCESGNKGGNIEYIRGTRSLEMHADIQDIDVLGNDIWIASDGGINYSDDECQTVEVRMTGITASDYWGFGQGWNEDIWVGGRYHNGDAVYHANYGPGNNVFLGGAETATGYVNPFDNYKTHYSDIGDKRVSSAISIPPNSLPNLGLYPTESYFDFSYSEVEWHPYHSNKVYIGKDNIFFDSTDGGANFDTLSVLGGDMRRFEISRADPEYIYAIVYYSYWDLRLFRSTDGGSTFAQISTPPYSGGSWRDLSMTLNPFDKDELWVASNSSSNGNKIFSSTDGGQNWTNRYSSVLENEGIKDLIYQPADGGDVIYAMTSTDFFYFDKGTGLWEVYSDGLPVLHNGFKMLPFFRDSKIRMASSKGIWEISMVKESLPQALPMVEADSVYCTRDTIGLESFSILDADGASWSWAITPAPTWVSSLAERNPRVVLGAAGTYDVTLTVTDANGASDSRMVADMIHVTNSCEADTIPGQVLRTDANGEYAVAHDVNLTEITHFTMTGWWKPNGAQQPFAALASSGDWCAHCDYTEGLIFNYSGDKLWYKWPGNSANWAGNSGITVPLDTWSYVAMVITPTGATLYLDDQKYEHSITLSPGNITNLYLGYGHYSKSFIGDIDEVTLWDRALTDDEVRTLRHITKEDVIGSDPNLIAYYQFSELINGTLIMDHAGSHHAIMDADADLAASTAPVGGGASQLVDLVSGQYDYQFVDAGLDLLLSDCEAVSGQLVATRLNIKPDVSANGFAVPDNYWFLNYYSEANVGFPALDSIALAPTDVAWVNNVSIATDVTLHRRTENGEGATWATVAMALELDAGQLLYDRKINISSGSQISLTDGAPSFTEVDPGKPCDPDSIPGNVLVLPGNTGDYAEIPSMNLNTNTLTISAWVKPDGIQNDWAGIVFCRGGSTTSGISCEKDNELRYHWNGGYWGWSSGAVLEVDVWSHIALVVTPTKAIIYLNGVAYENNGTHSVDAFDAITRIGNDANSGSRTFDGHIDEVCIWNRALSTAEIRALRHLTKEDEIATDPDLVNYLQFNESAGKAYDKTGNLFHATLRGGVSREVSTVPVGGGVSETVTVIGVGSVGAATGIELDFGSSGTYPDGDLVITKIHLHPDVNPSTTPVSDSYWVINNYGANKNFTALESITISPLGNTSATTTAADLHLVSRTENAFGANWSIEDQGDSYDTGTDAITFDSGLNLDVLGQLIVDNLSDGGLQWIGVEDTAWDNPNNWSGGIVPDASSDVVIPAGVPHYPIVTLNVVIKTLSVEYGATILMDTGYMFEVTAQ